MAIGKITRRGFVASAAAAQVAPRRPNLLFLIADDHAGTVLGASGDSLASTPHLDRLARDGVNFTAAYCNSPVCTASRQTFLTGQLPHAAGVTRLPTPLAGDRQTIARQLQAAGYRTAVFGKMHFNRKSSPGLHGFDYLMADGDVGAAMGRLPPPRPVPPGIRTLDANRGPSHKGDYKWLFPVQERHNVDKLPWPRYYDDMTGTFIARQAIRYLEENAGRPLALWVSFQEPHGPYRFPLEYRDRFKPSQFSAPKVGPEDGPYIPLTDRSLTPPQIQGILAAYYTSVSFLDQNIGEVLAAVDRLRLAEDTLVVYLSDHGLCLGHHGRAEKHCGYEPAVRVPLIFRYPRRISPRVAPGMVESLDVPATILDLLEVDPLKLQHGRSLRRQLEGKPAAEREFIFSEYLENEEAYLRTSRWKFMYCTGKRRRQDGYETDNPTPGRYVRLFDTAQDPNEYFNVASKHAALVKDFEEKMLGKFRDTHPESGQEPARLNREEALDWYLRPRDA